MKILFVDPPGINKGLNTGLAYISAVLKERHDILVLDLNNNKLGFCGDPNPQMHENEMDLRLSHALAEFEPELFGVSVKTFTSHKASDIFKFVRNKRPDLRTIAGGPHITLDGFNYLSENRIDLGVQGEGEDTMVELCNCLESKSEVSGIRGIYYWQNNKLMHNPRADNIKDLDSLPFPAYDNFSSIRDNKGTFVEYPILTSRGCPYNCSYCSMPTIMGKKWRYHSPERVIKELRHAKEKYNITNFTVVDDNFTLKLDRVESICTMLIDSRMGLPWNSQNGIRADRITEEHAKIMKKSGCQFVWIGIESVDEYVFNDINKGEKLEDIKKGIRHLKQAGIKVGGFFITGLPHSTRESDLKAIEFVKKLGIYGWWFNFVPYPHTRAGEWVKTYGKSLRSSDGVLQFGSSSIEPVFETEEYPRESRIKTYTEIHIRLKYFDRMADFSLKSWKKWYNVYTRIAPYGFGVIFSFFVFLLKHNVRLLLKAVKK